MNEISKQLPIVSENKYKTMIPPFPLLKPAPTDLYTEIRVEDTRKWQIRRISRIAQYIEVKSKKILKKSKDLPGFHRYIPKFSQKQWITMYNVHTGYKMTTYSKIEYQTNTGHRCLLKRRNTQPVLHLIHNI